MDVVKRIGRGCAVALILTVLSMNQAQAKHCAIDDEVLAAERGSAKNSHEDPANLQQDLAEPGAGHKCLRDGSCSACSHMVPILITFGGMLSGSTFVLQTLQPVPLTSITLPSEFRPPTRNR